MFTVTALSVFISTEADYFILLRYLTKDNYCSMFESTWYLNHFWFFTIETFYTLWNFKKLLCIFTRLNNWLHINSCLKICTCTPTVNLIVFIDCKTMTSSSCYIDNFEILEISNLCRTPSRICIIMTKLS